MTGAGWNGRTTAAMQRLGIALPIVQGPFGGGASTVELVVAVSERGGLGSFGAHMLSPAEIAGTCAAIRARTAMPFALNLWVSDHDPGGLAPDEAAFERAWRVLEPWFRELGVPRPELPQYVQQRYEDQVEALLDARPPVFSFVFGVPSTPVLDACRARGIVTIGAATSIAEAQALDEAGVDLIVASGAEAGGHRPSFLAPAEASLMGTLALVPQLVDRVRAPLIAAGGIADRRGIDAVLALGAQAAQLGTAFLACAESAASPLHREVLFSDRARHTVLTRAFTGRLARGVRNRWTDEVTAHVHELPPYPILGWFAARLRPAALAAGRTDLVSLWCGQAAPNLRHRSVAALMQSLFESAQSASTPVA